LTIAVILVVASLGVFFVERQARYSSLKHTTQEQALDAARTIEGGEIPDTDQVERFTLNGVVVIVRDEGGGVLARSSDPSGWTLPTENSASQASGDDNSDPVWQRALAKNSPADGDAQLSSEAPDYVYVVPVDPPEGPARIVEAITPYEPTREYLASLGGALAVGIVLGVLLTVAGAYLLARAALAPVSAVVGSAHEITEGQLSKRLPMVRSNDEIGRLITTINDLLTRLEVAFARREEALVRQRRFVSDAGHELRTPLTSIDGYARMLKKWGLKEPTITRESVEAIQKESRRMRGLVEDLLTMARGDEGARIYTGIYDLGVVAGEAVEAARAAVHGREIVVGYTPPDTPVEATFDRDRIRQVATILLDNAVKYTPEGGKVAVAVKKQHGWVRLEVSDTGVGIPEEQLLLVFERFHRTESSRTESGAGLGLAIARQIAEAHGANLEVTSEPDKGSTFILEIPRDARPARLTVSTEP
jgi:two-component system OmpR family sensor kinase